MLRFCSLGSGSTGNATLVEAHGPDGTSRLLVDCGLSLRELDSRLDRAGVMAGQIDAIFVTHEHGDHIGCARQLAKRHHIPLWMSAGTAGAVRTVSAATTVSTLNTVGTMGTAVAASAGVRRPGTAHPHESEPGLPIQHAHDGQTIALGGLRITPFAVPHDAREPLQLSCSFQGRKLGILTDLGHITPHVLTHLHQCHSLLLEFNHDSDMLARSSYPKSLKARVGGKYGHLSNAAAAQALQRLVHGDLRHVVAAHLSLQNNRPELASAAITEALGLWTPQVLIADALVGTPWITV